MRLSDVVGRDAPVEWYEAVAVVRELIDRIEGSPVGRVPELDQIELLSAGAIEVLGGAATDDRVRHVTQILRGLLVNSTSPKELAALLDQPAPSLRALSEALAAFERPNRPGVLQQLYLRMVDSAPLPGADELIASLRATVTTQPPQEDKQAAGEHRRHNLLYAGAAGAGVLLIAVVLAFLWRGYADASINSAVSSIGQRLGLAATDVPSPAVEEVAQPAGPAEVESTSFAKRTAPTGKSASVVARIPKPAEMPLARLPRPRLGLDFSLGVPRREPVERVIRASKPEPDLNIYSSGSTEVAPPVGIRPHVPKEVPPQYDPRRIARIEIVIDTAGNVESAKLLAGPRIMHDAMLVSAAKGWRFHPATRDGIPVRYRTTVLMPW